MCPLRLKKRLIDTHAVSSFPIQYLIKFTPRAVYPGRDLSQRAAPNVLFFPTGIPTWLTDSSPDSTRQAACLAVGRILLFYSDERTRFAKHPIIRTPALETVKAPMMLPAAMAAPLSPLILILKTTARVPDDRLPPLALTASACFGSPVSPALSAGVARVHPNGWL